MGFIDRIAETIETGYLVIGAGVAGLRAAIELAPAGPVLVVAKDRLEESSSQYAQGGIAAALSDDDEVELHEADTIAAGDGLCDREAVRTLVREGPKAIQELIEWGTHFDREGPRLHFAREGAHSRSRVLHSHGDSTGREIARTLYLKAASLEAVRFASFAGVLDLTVDEGRVTGAVAFDERRGELLRLRARAILLATGGLGRVYLDTTNPDVATGDGVAAAWRAGAAISDIEFVQFHPTALHIEGAPRFLLSEALRGEGAWLLNAKGERFMQRRHPLAELAPRDVVSRCIVSEMESEGSPHVWLDLSWRGAEFVRRRFPRVHATCLSLGIDLDRQAAPVRPAAHYAMGGVRTTLEGRTSLEGLFAAGEAACTGVHGANRLASNSLLEGVVFGARAGAAMREAPGGLRGGGAPEFTVPRIEENELRRLAWEHTGILRSGAGLLDFISRIEALPLEPRTPSRAAAELRSLHTTALLIARCALAREESRGAHRRTDFPETSPRFARHSEISLSSAGAVFR
jgi:L-aspartate oxidase